MGVFSNTVLNYDNFYNFFYPFLIPNVKGIKLTQELHAFSRLRTTALNQIKVVSANL